MVSRLDRLFILLDTGSNESIRLAAAKQLGQVQRIQPNDLDYLLKRIKEYSYKSVWETRIAAGNAIRCVLEEVEPWPPENLTIEGAHLTDSKIKCRQNIIENSIEAFNYNDIFKQFDINKIISQCPKLLSLDNIDNVDESDTNKPTTSKPGRGQSKRGNSRKAEKEQLLRQRKLINKELGISMVDSLNLGVKSTDIVSNDDLQVDYDKSPPGSIDDQSYSSLDENRQQQDTKAIVQSFSSNYDALFQNLVNGNCIYQTSSLKQEPNDTNQNITSPNKYLWPLLDLTKSYANDLFNPSWEVRHGAAIALREIVKCQGKFAGKFSQLSDRSNDKLNQLWLIDMAFKAISVLTLDKFGDFLFDQVVAPVRETSAQLLGCCVANMSEDNAHTIIRLILIMLQNEAWETRHGGILGLKYSLNIVEASFGKKLLQECFDPIYKCLGDPVDDVSAEAAASLVPIKDLMIEVIPERAPILIKFLWEHLSDLDELTTSTSNIVLLLASLITSTAAQLETTELTKSIPRLWSLLGHSSTSVRISVLKALLTLMKPQKTNCLSWMPEELSTTAMRLIFQRSILENMDEVRPHIEDVWLHLIKVDETSQNSQTERFNLLKSVSQYLNYWLCLVLQPSNVPIDRGSPMWLNIRSDGTISDTKPDGNIYIASITFNVETANIQKNQVTKTRLLSTRLLGALYASLVNDLKDNPESQHSKDAMKYLADMFVHYIKTKSANQRIISGWAIESWASMQDVLSKSNFDKMKNLIPETLIEQMKSAIQETNLCYDELASTFTRLQQETRDFVASLKNADVILDLKVLDDRRAIYNLNQIQSLCDLNIELELNRISCKRSPIKPKEKMVNETARNQIYTTLLAKKTSLTKSLNATQQSQRSLSKSVLSSIACAFISWRILPDSLSQLINPLMDSIELEEDQNLQNKSIKYLIMLIDILCENGPNQHDEFIESILRKLIDVLSCRALSMMFESNDSNSIPEIPNSARCSIDAGNQTLLKNNQDFFKIILLDNLQRKAESTKAQSRRQSAISGATNLKRSHSLTTSQEIILDSNMADSSHRATNPQDDVIFEVKLRGSSAVLRKLTEYFQDGLPKKLPQFWTYITDDIRAQVEAHRKLEAGFDQSANEIKLIKSLRLLEVVGDRIHINLRKNLLHLYDDIIFLLSSSNPIIRHHSAQCIGVISNLMLNDTIDLISRKILLMLTQVDNTLARCGSIEAIALIIEHLQLDLVPKIDMFIIPVLRRMSDQNDQVRLMATHCFGKLLSLMPLNLNSSSSEVDNNTESFKKESDIPDTRNEDQRFIEQLLNPKKLDNFKVPFKIQAELRSYQQDGLNWLAFLNRFNLHGILCDEMGLGKTFMTICMVAADHFNESQKENFSESPSLIVCPSTLTEHWLYEIEKFLPLEMRKALNPASYSGTLNERNILRSRITTSKQTIQSDSFGSQTDKRRVNLVVTSYDIVRNDIEFFKDVNWNYCVLDEGHIIKNGKTKLSRAIRLLNGKHRLILSGTPIQNNVTELWSLFDFLMPGFLGSERQFNVKYTKPILQSRELKCSARELEAGALAMESLHRQVLPFILRRLKEDVLDDLPPKIIQDYYCELSSLQQKLYEDFTRSKLCNDITKKSIQELNEFDEDTTEKVQTSKSHVFQALQYLKNVCNHPKLVLTQKHSKYNEFKKYVESEKMSLDDIEHSSKLKALKQLLIDCGIGLNGSGQSMDDSQQQQQQVASNLTVESVVNQHRALIFCQIRTMVNIIENDLLKKHLPSVTYLKLDGSVPANQRQSIVSRFNNDPSIDILLLTTQIGGLGLNLTGADTVIFVEHDWNPTKDLQAMDRAHRIGQKKVVNVYRLITKGTLEEKIMGLQKFKTMVSNTVINQDNTGLGTMKVDQLFDLFEDSAAVSSTGDKSFSTSKEEGRSSGTGRRSFMDLLPELWDQQQYDTEYDLSNFVSSLKN